MKTPMKTVFSKVLKGETFYLPENGGSLWKAFIRTDGSSGISVSDSTEVVLTGTTVVKVYRDLYTFAQDSYDRCTK